MRRTLRPMIWLALALLLAVSSAVVAFAQGGDSVEACEGASVSGTVVSVDVVTGMITVEQSDGSLCTVQLDSDYDHPITSLLGSFFNDVDADSLGDAIEALNVEFDCPPGEGCDLVDDGSGTDGQVAGVTDLGGGLYEIEIQYMDGEGNPATATIVVDDETLAADWMEALEALQVEWDLKSEDGSVFVNDAGDEIAALHEDGMGFGVIVKLYSMADAAATACAEQQADAEPTEGDLCSVSLEGLVEAFKNGTGLGQLFQEYGKPAHLGVGHIRQENRDRDNGPPDTACGYWRKHGPLSPDHPCYQGEGAAAQDKGNGKPPWAGSPGGPNGNQGRGKSD